MIDQVTRHLITTRMLRNGTQRAVIRLNPEELGPVRVTVDVRGGQVHLDLAAGDSALAALRKDLPGLRTQLAGSGLDLANVTLHTPDPANGDRPGHPGSAQPGADQAGSNQPGSRQAGSGQPDSGRPGAGSSAGTGIPSGSGSGAPGGAWSGRPGGQDARTDRSGRAEPVGAPGAVAAAPAAGPGSARAGSALRTHLDVRV